MNTPSSQNIGGSSLERVDLIVVGAREVLTLPRPVRGRASHESIGLVEDGAVAVRNGLVVEAGPEDLVMRRYRASQVVEARGSVVTPGLVDPHTHLIYSGSREDEREALLAGIPYQEILARGGGIRRTIEATSRTSDEDLVRGLLARLEELLASGVTVAEVKTGYGAGPDEELRLLRLIRRAGSLSRVTVIPTLLAHVPPRGAGRREYVEIFASRLIPKAREEGALFVDVFCDEEAFSPEEARTILSAGLGAGLGARIHADEFSYIGCSDVGLDLGASSLDHLNHTPGDVVKRISGSGSTAVLAPSTALAIVGAKPPSRDLLDLGALVAIATDHSPALMNLDMVETINLAVNYLGLPPGNAIASATVNAANSLGLAGSRGSLVPGASADLVVWSIPNHRWFGYLSSRKAISAVIRGGAVVKPVCP